MPVVPRAAARRALTPTARCRPRPALAAQPTTSGPRSSRNRRAATRHRARSSARRPPRIKRAPPPRLFGPEPCRAGYPAVFFGRSPARPSIGRSRPKKTAGWQRGNLPFFQHTIPPPAPSPEGGYPAAPRGASPPPAAGQRKGRGSLPGPPLRSIFQPRRPLRRVRSVHPPHPVQPEGAPRRRPAAAVVGCGVGREAPAPNVGHVDAAVPGGCRQPAQPPRLLAVHSAAGSRPAASFAARPAAIRASIAARSSRSRMRSAPRSARRAARASSRRASS
jgi:hypothetical protein